MAQKLKGKVAVVTGGGGGIGGGIAKALAVEGVSVVVNDIPRSDGVSAADKVVDEIKNAGGNAVASYDSVTTMEGGENIVKTAVSNFGRVDILVNCAGNFKPMTNIIEMTEDDWDSVVDVHLKGHFSCIKAAAAEMIKQESGRIITFSSRAAFAGGGGPRPSSPPPPPPPPEDGPRKSGGPPGLDLAYTAAKAGIVGLTMALAGVLGAHGITVNAILPSANTNLFPGTTPRGGMGFPATVFLDPEYLAPVVVYLCTDEAKDITGQLFYASGGDVCIYNRPLQPKSFIRKNGKWTIDELGELIPPLL
jgi:NAD(P)-dependent dehydrogenase (short-subunit alcohol dehydrogenase family)